MPLDLPDHQIGDDTTIKDINAVKLFDDRQEGLQKTLRAMKLDDPDHRRALHLIDMIRHHPAERAYAIPALSNAFRDYDGIVRRSAAEALATRGPAAADAVPALSEALRDADKNVRRSGLATSMSPRAMLRNSDVR